MFEFGKYYDPGYFCIEIVTKDCLIPDNKLFFYDALNFDKASLPPCREIYYVSMYRNIAAVRTDVYPLLWTWYWFKVFIACRVWEALSMGLFLLVKNKLNMGIDFIHPAIYAPRNPIKLLYYFALNQGKEIDQYTI